MIDSAQVLAQLLTELKEVHVNPQIDLSGKPSDIIFSELQLDSLDILSLAMALEEAFDIEIEINELPRDASLTALSDFLLQLINN